MTQSCGFHATLLRAAVSQSAPTKHTHMFCLRLSSVCVVILLGEATLLHMHLQRCTSSNETTTCHNFPHTQQNKRELCKGPGKQKEAGHKDMQKTWLHGALALWPLIDGFGGGEVRLLVM